MHCTGATYAVPFSNATPTWSSWSHWFAPRDSPMIMSWTINDALAPPHFRLIYSQHQIPLVFSYFDFFLFLKFFRTFKFCAKIDFFPLYALREYVHKMAKIDDFGLYLKVTFWKFSFTLTLYYTVQHKHGYISSYFSKLTPLDRKNPRPIFFLP